MEWVYNRRVYMVIGGISDGRGGIRDGRGV